MAPTMSWPDRMRRRQASEYLAAQHGVTVEPRHLGEAGR